jgi:hypothetical protein
LPGGKREGNKCVVRDDDDDIPRLCVSLAVFLFFSFSGSFVGEKTLPIALLKVHSSFSSDIYAVNQSFRLYAHMRLSSFNVLFNVLIQA